MEYFIPYHILQKTSVHLQSTPLASPELKKIMRRNNQLYFACCKICHMKCEVILPELLHSTRVTTVFTAHLMDT